MTDRPEPDVGDNIDKMMGAAQLYGVIIGLRMAYEIAMESGLKILDPAVVAIYTKATNVNAADVEAFEASLKARREKRKADMLRHAEAKGSA